MRPTKEKKVDSPKDEKQGSELCGSVSDVKWIGPQEKQRTVISDQ